MDDQFLRDLKKQPNPEFAARLRATLRALPPNAVARVAPAADFKRWFAAAASIAVVGFAFTLPPVQAAAEAFLDLFRVKQFTGVAVRPGAARSSLESSGFEPGSDLRQRGAAHDAAGARLVRDGGRRRRGRGDSRAHAGLGSAGLLEHGFHGVVGAWRRASRSTPPVCRRCSTRSGSPTSSCPKGLDGQTATVRLPPVVTQTFVNRDLVVTDRNGEVIERSVHVIQAQSPDVSFPAGLDLSKLAYAGLRVLGMSRDEAYRMSVTIDWRTTLIVPVPSKAVAYRPDQRRRQRGPVDRRSRGRREVPRRRADVVRGRRDVRGRRCGQR